MKIGSGDGSSYLVREWFGVEVALALIGSEIRPTILTICPGRYCPSIPKEKLIGVGGK